MRKIWTLASPLALALTFTVGPALVAPAAVAAPVINAPRLSAKPGAPTIPAGYGWASSNWSGYAVTGGTYHAITGSWIVPPVSTTHGKTYSSTWIGIDGFNNQDLIQTGTEQDAAKSGNSYYAWWEILPAAETTIPNMTIHPGDHMTASITDNGNGTWTISLRDVTTAQSFTTTQAYTGPGQSAEWIMEAPTLGNKVSQLADYGLATITPDTVNGVSPNFALSDAGVMFQKHTGQVSTPSVPNAVNDGFDTAYGAVAPPAP